MKKITAFLLACFLFSVPQGRADAQKEDGSVELKPLWVAEGFNNPESVLFDSKRSVYYVSNVAGAPLEKDGKGFISKLSVKGNILNLQWVKGLNAPKGLGLVGNTLLVADIDELVEIDVGTGIIVKKHKIPGAKMLNDIAVSATDEAYISDMFDNAIYHWKSPELSLWMRDARLENPNGLAVVDSSLYVASWGPIVDGFKTKVPGQIKRINLIDQKIKEPNAKNRIGNLDGLEPIKDGFLATDWISGKVYEIGFNGRFKEILQLPSGSADLEVNEGIVLIPLMNDNQVRAFTFNPL